MWAAAGDEVFEVSMRRQAEAFARAIGGRSVRGRTGPRRDRRAARRRAGGRSARETRELRTVRRRSGLAP